MTQPILLQNTWKMLHRSTINILYCTCRTWLDAENLMTCKLINLLRFLIAFMKDMPQLNYLTQGDSWKSLLSQISDLFTGTSDSSILPNFHIAFGNTEILSRAVLQKLLVWLKTSFPWNIMPEKLPQYFLLNRLCFKKHSIIQFTCNKTNTININIKQISNVNIT